MVGRLLIFVHVLGAIVWFGGGLLFQTASERAAAKRDRATIEAIARVGKSLGTAYFAVASMVVFAAGIALVFARDWSFEEPFIVGGIAGWLASTVVGARLIGPASERLYEMTSGGSASEADVLAGVTRLRDLGRIDLVIMTVVVFLMTVKPGV